MFWWESSYRLPSELFEIEKIYKSVKQFERYIRRRIANTSYSTFLQHGIIRYVRALDEHDMTTAFLALERAGIFDCNRKG